MIMQVIKKVTTCVILVKKTNKQNTTKTPLFGDKVVVPEMTGMISPLEENDMLKVGL